MARVTLTATNENSTLSIGTNPSRRVLLYVCFREGRIYHLVRSNLYPLPAGSILRFLLCCLLPYVFYYVVNCSLTNFRQHYVIAVNML